MTSSVVLKIFFHGLIAFVPNKEVYDKPTAMTAYLIEDQNHYSHLAFELPNKDAKCPEESIDDTKCMTDRKFGPDWCICRLGKGVTLDFDPDPEQQGYKFEYGGYKGKPIPSYPQKKSDASNIFWLLQVSSIEKAAATPKKINLTKYSRADIEFGLLKDPSAAQTCILDQQNTWWLATNVHPISFLKGADSHTQAVAEHVVFMQNFTKQPSLYIRKRDYHEKKIKIDIPCASGRCPDLLISNGTTQGNCSASGCGEHFGHYYKLTDDAKDKLSVQRVENEGESFLFTLRLATCDDDPLLKRLGLLEVYKKKLKLSSGQYKSSLSLFDYIVLAVDTRIICPMAMFDPAQ